jgi:hypothetical protein
MKRPPFQVPKAVRVKSILDNKSQTAPEGNPLSKGHDQARGRHFRF